MNVGPGSDMEVSDLPRERARLLADVLEKAAGAFGHVADELEAGEAYPARRRAAIELMRGLADLGTLLVVEAARLRTARVVLPSDEA